MIPTIIFLRSNLSGWIHFNRRHPFKKAIKNHMRALPQRRLFPPPPFKNDLFLCDEPSHDTPPLEKRVEKDSMASASGVSFNVPDLFDWARFASLPISIR